MVWKFPSKRDKQQGTSDKQPIKVESRNEDRIQNIYKFKKVDLKCEKTKETEEEPSWIKLKSNRSSNKIKNIAVDGLSQESLVSVDRYRKDNKEMCAYCRYKHIGRKRF